MVKLQLCGLCLTARNVFSAKCATITHHIAGLRFDKQAGYSAFYLLGVKLFGSGGS